MALYASVIAVCLAPLTPTRSPPAVFGGFSPAPPPGWAGVFVLPPGPVGRGGFPRPPAPGGGGGGGARGRSYRPLTPTPLPQGERGFRNRLLPAVVQQEL